MAATNFQFYSASLIVLIMTSLLQVAMTFQPSDIEPPINSGHFSAEKRLITRLMHNYDKIGRNGRPVVNISRAVPVKFGLGLIQMDLDEKNNMLSMSTWTRYSWIDDYLMWTPHEYENITNIRLAPDLLWIPDITLYNTPLVAATIKDADLDLASRHALAVVDFKGRVSWYPHTLFRSSCSLDVANFPFDKQICTMWFGSWTYSSSELQLDMAFPGGIDLNTFQDDYKDSCAWTISNVTNEKKFLPAEEVLPNFIVLTFDLYLTRKMVFSSYILTLPCIFLACLTLVVFWLPPERPDRTSLAMSIFNSFLVLLLILVEAAPPTASSIPTIGVYYCFNMVIIMLSVILSSFVVNISRGSFSGKRVPKWARVAVGRWLATLLYLARHQPPSLRPTQKSRDSVRMGGKFGKQEAEVMLEHAQGEIRCQNGSAQVDSMFVTLTTQLQSLENHLKDMRFAVDRLDGKLNSETTPTPEKNMIFQEWRFIALVVDRFFFILYFVLIIISLTTLFPKINFNESE